MIDYQYLLAQKTAQPYWRTNPVIGSSVPEARTTIPNTSLSTFVQSKKPELVESTPYPPVTDLGRPGTTGGSSLSSTNKFRAVVVIMGVPTTSTWNVTSSPG